MCLLWLLGIIWLVDCVACVGFWVVLLVLLMLKFGLICGVDVAIWVSYGCLLGLVCMFDW